MKCINSDLKRINFAIEINFVSNWAKHISVSRPPWDRNPKDPRTKYKPTPSLWESIKILYTKMPGLCIYKQKYRKFERLKYWICMNLNLHFLENTEKANSVRSFNHMRYLRHMYSMNTSQKFSPKIPFSQKIINVLKFGTT